MSNFVEIPVMDGRILTFASIGQTVPYHIDFTYDGTFVLCNYTQSCDSCPFGSSTSEWCTLDDIEDFKEYLTSYPEILL